MHQPLTPRADTKPTTGRVQRGTYTLRMSKSSVERRLAQVSERLRQLRRELEVSAEQLAHLADAADDARLRALVSETPVADRDSRQAERHAEAMRRHRAKVEAEIARLEREQDDLLDRFVAESKSR